MLDIIRYHKILLDIVYVILDPSNTETDTKLIIVWDCI